MGQSCGEGRHKAILVLPERQAQLGNNDSKYLVVRLIITFVSESPDAMEESDDDESEDVEEDEDDGGRCV